MISSTADKLVSFQAADVAASNLQPSNALQIKYLILTVILPRGANGGNAVMTAAGPGR